MNLQRAPMAPLRPFVKLVWYSDDAGGPWQRERVLPTGTMHLVIRLSGHPVRIYPAVDAPDPLDIATATIAGARAAFYVKDVARPLCTVGAVLQPTASLPLVGVPAVALAGRHTALADVWGPDVDRLRDRLRELASPHDRLALFESALAARLPRVRGVHPAIAEAVAGLETSADVATVVGRTGYSHRWLLTAFREAVGLAPKAYSRVVRMQRVLRARRQSGASWAALAAAAGYADQAHLTRELRAMTGVAPGELARLAPLHDNHVPVPARSDSFKTRGRRGARVCP